MHSRLRTNQVNAFKFEKTNGLFSTSLSVEVSIGFVFKPMKLHASIFTPKPSDTSDFIGDPVALLASSPEDTMKFCEKYIEDMINNPV